ncbi:hypothetical protein ACHQM5_025528 [Ranunculus cassubicifolius]
MNSWARIQECPCAELKCQIRSQDCCNGDDNDEDEEGASSSTITVESPFVGQVFFSDEDAFQYYSNFAKSNGFAIRRESSKSSQKLGTYRRELVCYRAGVARHRKSAIPERQKNRKSTLCECQAKMTIVKEFLSTVPQWTVKKFSNDHNHELLEDEQLRLLPAYRKIPAVDRQRILLLRRAGYSTSHIMKILGSEKGGHPVKKLPFLDRDVRNFIHSATKKTDRRKDAMELLNMCKDLKERNANFVYECIVERMVNLKSLHGHMRTLFLLTKRFGIRDAIASELPHTKHVFCMWHVFSRLSSWFYHPLGSRYEEFKSEFTRLYNIETVKDFERLWNQMVSCFGLQSNKHIALLSTHRASWALPYVKGFFHAGMTKFERSKMIDEYLEEILSLKTGTDNFFEKVGIITKFGYQTGEDEMEDVHIKTSMPMEEHASSILTPYAFNLLQQEITMSMQCAAYDMPNGLYLVRHHKQSQGGHLVSWTPRDEKIQCTCKEFDFTGILCRHALRVLALKNYFHIPENYLLIRWRKESSLIFQTTQSDIVDWPQAFHSLSAALYAESVVSKEQINYVQSELTKVLNHVKNMQGSDVHLSMEAAPAFDARIEDVGAESSANSSECISVGCICQSNTCVYQSEVSIQN